MKLATWNINSVRLRIDQVRQFCDEQQPDVLCLQETKVRDELFPRDDFTAMGFNHLLISGQKSYNGVVIASKIPFTDTSTLSWCDKEDKRHAGVVLQNGVELHNFYIPAGGDEPDPVTNPKFAHKLQFLDELIQWSAGLSAPKRIMVGDFNIAPLETDVWDHKKLRNIITHTQVEIDRLTTLMSAGNWQDGVRAHILPDEKCFTWWSYRAKDWKAANKGRRLDHIWVTPDLLPATHSAHVHLDARGWEKPSDHAPLSLTLNI